MPGGSPPFTAAAREALLNALKVGNTRAAAARFAGITPERLEAMLARSPALRTAVANAEASAEVSSVSAVATAAKGGDWRAASYLLERRQPVDPPSTCGALTRAGKSCSQPRGHKTDHPGSGNCWLHGGRTPNGKRHAQVEAVENALRTLRIEDAVDPVASLFEAVRVAAWREQGLRMMLQARPSLFGPDHQGDERPDVIAVMHGDALADRAKIAAMAINAGLDERIVRLAEAQGEVIHRIITTALDAAGVVGEPRTRAEDAVVRELMAVGPSADERN